MNPVAAAQTHANAERSNCARWATAMNAVAQNPAIMGLLAIVLLLPLAATAGQCWASAFYRQSVRFELLFWPGVHWSWGPRINVGILIASIGVLYVTGIGALFYRGTLAKVVLAGIGAALIANVLGGAVNHFTGWRELQNMSALDLSGKANRAIISLWHNPVWEELVFRGLPLLCYWAIARYEPTAERVTKWCYFLVPSIIFAAYHVPGHGYSRIADTLILSLAFAWLALRYGFLSVVVLHCLFDAMMVSALPKIKSIPPDEVRWLGDHAAFFNTTQSLAVLSLIGLAIALLAHCAWKHRHSTAGDGVSGL